MTTKPTPTPWGIGSRVPEDNTLEIDDGSKAGLLHRGRAVNPSGSGNGSLAASRLGHALD